MRNGSMRRLNGDPWVIHTKINNIYSCTCNMSQNRYYVEWKRLPTSYTCTLYLMNVNIDHEVQRSYVDDPKTLLCYIHICRHLQVTTYSTCTVAMHGQSGIIVMYYTIAKEQWAVTKYMLCVAVLTRSSGMVHSLLDSLCVLGEHSWGTWRGGSYKSKNGFTRRLKHEWYMCNIINCN